MANPWEEYAASASPWDEYAALPEVSAGAEAKMPKKADKTDWLKRATTGYTDPFNAIAQVAARGLTAVGLPPTFDMDQGIKDDERRYQEMRGDNAGSFDGARMVGNIINPINVAITSRIPMKAGFGAKVLGGAGAGAGSGLLNPVIEGDFWNEKAKQAGFGAAVGGAVPVAISGVSRVISPKSATNESLQLLKGMGVRPTVGQTLGGGFNKVEEQLMSVPILGHAIARARENANAQFRAGAYSDALGDIGVALPKGLAGRDAVAFTQSSLSNNYNKVLDKIGAVPVDDVFVGKVDNLKSMVDKLNVPQDAKQRFLYAIDDVGAYTGNNKALTSDGYKLLEGSLGRDAKSLAAHQDSAFNKVAPAISQLRQEVKDLLRRQSGDNANALDATNRGWAKYKRIERAAGSLGAEKGNWTPAQLLNATKASDWSKDRGQFAQGRAFGQDIADAGKDVLGSKVPDSGTAGRALLTLMAGGAAGGAFAPAALAPTVAGLLGGAAAYSTPGQWVANKLVSGRPQFTQPISKFLQNYGNALIPAANASVPYHLNKQGY